VVHLCGSILHNKDGVAISDINNKSKDIFHWPSKEEYLKLIEVLSLFINSHRIMNVNRN